MRHGRTHAPRRNGGAVVCPCRPRQRRRRCCRWSCRLPCRHAWRRRGCRCRHRLGHRRLPERCIRRQYLEVTLYVLHRPLTRPSAAPRHLLPTKRRHSHCPCSHPGSSSPQSSSYPKPYPCSPYPCSPSPCSPCPCGSRPCPKCVRGWSGGGAPRRPHRRRRGTAARGQVLRQ